ncbi:unnamed protein product [Symbiodinium sp. CCMP2456]|nr:unnamed protein product [Symbiodinium sp. CCMP2456]
MRVCVGRATASEEVSTFHGPTVPGPEACDSDTEDVSIMQEMIFMIPEARRLRGLEFLNMWTLKFTGKSPLSWAWICPQARRQQPPSLLLQDVLARLRPKKEISSAPCSP